MPLEESGSDEAFERNVAEMIRAGHPRDQALAAAYAIKRKHGGKDGETAEKAYRPQLLILKAAMPSPPEPAPEPAAQPEPEPVAVLPEPLPTPEMRMGSADQIEEARRFGDLGKAMRLIDPERPHIAHLVGPDLARPEVWRHTELVDDEPFSDAEFDRVEDAFLSALRAGGLPSG